MALRRSCSTSTTSEPSTSSTGTRRATPSCAHSPTTAAQAVGIAEEIRGLFDAVTVPGTDGSPVRATVSAGCAAMGADDDRFSDIIARADVGLVMAKRAGRDRVIAA